MESQNSNSKKRKNNKLQEVSSGLAQKKWQIFSQGVGITYGGQERIRLAEGTGTSRRPAGVQMCGGDI